MSNVNGLTSKDMKVFQDITTKANSAQLRILKNKLLMELEKRGEQE